MAFRSRKRWGRKRAPSPEHHDVLLEGYVERELVAPDGSRHRVRVPCYSPPIHDESTIDLTTGSK